MGHMVVIEPNEISIHDVDAVTLELLQTWVGGYITPVTSALLPDEAKCPVPISFYVDEDGLQKGLPGNGVATVLGRTLLVGNAVIVKSEGADDVPLSTEEMASVMRWILGIVQPEEVEVLG